MSRRPPRSTRTDTFVSDTTLVRSQTLRINYVILDVLPALNLHGVLPQVVGLLIAVPADLLLTKDLVGHKHVFDDLVPLAVAEGHINSHVTPDRKSVVKGKSVSVRVDLGGRRIIKKKQNKNK